MAIAFVWFVCAVVTAIIASSRGRNGFGWFLLGCIFGIFAVILVAALPSQKAVPIVVEGEVATAATHVRCPSCKGLVRKDAVVCLHCRKDLTPDTTPPAPVRSLRPWAQNLVDKVKRPLDTHRL